MAQQQGSVYFFQPHITDRVDRRPKGKPHIFRPAASLQVVVSPMPLSAHPYLDPS